MPELMENQYCCNLKTESGSQCRQSRINNINPFNIYLCNSHIKYISKNHLENYYRNVMRNTIGDTNEEYLTISDNVRERLLNGSSELIPYNTNKDTNLVIHQVLIENGSFYRINIPQYNYTFDIMKRTINVRVSRSRTIRSRVIQRQLNTEIDSPNNSIIRLTNELSQYLNALISNNEGEQIRYIENTNQNRYIYNEENYKVIDINECSICCFSSVEDGITCKGILLSCCNDCNTICLKCIINQLITEYLKYNDITNIRNYNFINSKVNCPYCRNENCYKSLLKSSENKLLIKDILREKLREYYNDKMEEQLLLLN